MQLCPFTLDFVTAALQRKGFAVKVRTKPGSADELADWLADASQLWVISHSSRLLTDAHIAAISDLWHRGGSLYIWGDNAPFYADANAITTALFDDVALTQQGNTIGNEVVGEFDDGKRVGFLPHLVTTGLVNLYEGITIATINTIATAITITIAITITQTLKGIKDTGDEFEGLVEQSANDTVVSVLGVTLTRNVIDSCAMMI